MFCGFAPIPAALGFVCHFDLDWRRGPEPLHVTVSGRARRRNEALTM
jgi:hypothetical protein